jgi:hypothetical protein
MGVSLVLKIRTERARRILDVYLSEKENENGKVFV